MPTLEAKVFIDGTKIPCIWGCSNCNAAFDTGSTREATISELHKIDAEFRAHCADKHPGDSVIGIQFPKIKEDASQAAARIVREATEGR